MAILFLWRMKRGISTEINRDDDLVEVSDQENPLQRGIPNRWMKMGKVQKNKTL